MLKARKQQGLVSVEPAASFILDLPVRYCSTVSCWTVNDPNFFFGGGGSRRGGAKAMIIQIR